MSFLVYSQDKGSFFEPQRINFLGTLTHALDLLGGLGSWHWMVQEAQMLESAGFDNAKYALITDLKPKRTDIISFYRITDIWGVSEETWTPLCLRLRPLLEDEAVKDADSTRNQFTVNLNRLNFRVSAPAHEFLYVHHGQGVKSAKWHERLDRRRTPAHGVQRS